jgi:alkylation response protein AidB-like acyl-CoA dehydrogenase
MKDPVKLPIIAAARALQDELMGPPSMPADDEGTLADARRDVEALRKTALMMFGLALQTYGEKLSDEQEVLTHVADILIDVYTADSCVLRAAAAADARMPQAAPHADAAQVFVNDAAMRVDASARQALATMTEGDTLRTMLVALRRVLKVTPINTTVRRRRLADEAVRRGGYIF